MAILFSEYSQEFWPVRKLYINQFCFYRPNLFFPQVLPLSVSDLKRVRSAKQKNPLIDLRPMAVEYISRVKMHAGCYRCITLRCSSSVCPSPDTILLFFFFLFSFFFFHVLRQTIILGTLTYLLELLPGKTGKLWSSNLPD